MIRGTDGLDYETLSDRFLGIPANTARNYDVIRLTASQKAGYLTAADVREVLERRERVGDYNVRYTGPDIAKYAAYAEYALVSK